MQKAIVISQGDEITSGEFIDQNGPWLARNLTERGYRVLEIKCLPDHLERLIEAFKESASQADTVWVTGGLGPTEDDLTSKAASIAFDSKQKKSIEATKQIESYLQKRNRKWNPGAEKMARLPEKAAVIQNPLGSAPGFKIQTQRCCSYFFPGVPIEMKEMAMAILNSLPTLTQKIQHRFYTMGISESRLVHQLKRVTDNGLQIAYRASRTGNTVKLNNPTPEQVEQTRTIIKSWTYSETESNIAKVVVETLGHGSETVSVAESCTGGLLASWLIDCPGASQVVEQGVVTYSNRSKTRLCNVHPKTIATHGAVSKETAMEMAEGIRRNSETDWGISTTGIAGPGGGTKTKPVGLVYIAIANATDCFHLKLNLHGTRRQIRESATAMALFFLYKQMKKTKKPC